MSTQRRIVYLGVSPIIHACDTPLTASKANGAFGSVMTEELLRAGWHVVILARTPSSVPARPNTTVVQYTATDRKSLIDAMRGAEVVLCTATGIDQMPLIDAAVEAGVTRFVPSEYAADLDYPSIRASPLYKGRVALLEHLRTLAGEGKIQWTVFNVGAILDLSKHAVDLRPLS